MTPCSIACHHDGPATTSARNIPAKEVCEGDFLDTRQETVTKNGSLARVTMVTCPPSRSECIIHAEGQRPRVYRKDERVHVWRDTRLADDARPIDARYRPFRNLNEVHRAGSNGLNAMFPVDSIWEVGPFQHGVDPWVVRITGPAHTQGVNYSAAPEDAEARGKACWFMPTETIYDPFHDTGSARAGSGQPPHVLAPLTPRMAAKLGLGCCDCVGYVPPCPQRVLSCNAGVIQSMRADAEALHTQMAEQAQLIATLEQKLADTQLRANTAQRQIRQVKQALR